MIQHLRNYWVRISEGVFIIVFCLIFSALAKADFAVMLGVFAILEVSKVRYDLNHAGEVDDESRDEPADNRDN